MRKIRYVVPFLVIAVLEAHNSSVGHGAVDSLKARADSLMRVGTRLYAEARFREAIQAFQGAGADTGGAQSRFYLGMCHLSVNEFDKARQLLNDAVLADSSNTGYRFRFAGLLTQLGESASAEEQYDSILRKEPSFVPALFNLGLLLFEQKDYRRSAELFNRAIRWNPRDFLSYFYLGLDMTALENSDSARVCYATCMTLNRIYVPAIINLGTIHYERKTYDEALRLFRLASSLRPSAADLSYKSGLCYQQLKNWELALQSFQKAVQQNPSKDDYEAQLGYAYYQLRKFDSSAIAYKKAISIDSTVSLHHLNLAFAYSSLDSIDRAVAEFHRAIDLRHPEEIAKIYNYLGGFYFHRNRFRDAAASYRRALDYDVANRDARFFLALTYERTKDFRSARETFEKYLAISPKDSTQGDWKQYAKKRVQDLKRKSPPR